MYNKYTYMELSRANQIAASTILNVAARKVYKRYQIALCPLGKRCKYKNEECKSSRATM